MIKLLHQIIYYIILIPVSLGLIIVGLMGSLRWFDSYYYRVNDFLNSVKGEYQEIGR